MKKVGKMSNIHGPKKKKKKERNNPKLLKHSVENRQLGDKREKKNTDKPTSTLQKVNKGNKRKNKQ